MKRFYRWRDFFRSKPFCGSATGPTPSRPFRKNERVSVRWLDSSSGKNYLMVSNAFRDAAAVSFPANTVLVVKETPWTMIGPSI